MRRKNLLAALLLIGVSVSASAAYALVQARGKAGPGDPIVYSIKFLCGFVTPQTEARLGLKPANYETDIDIHNPDTVGVVKVAQKKFILSVPEPAPGGIVQSPRTVVRGFILPASKQLSNYLTHHLFTTNLTWALVSSRPSSALSRGFHILVRNDRIPTGSMTHRIQVEIRDGYLKPSNPEG